MLFGPENDGILVRRFISLTAGQGRISSLPLRSLVGTSRGNRNGSRAAIAHGAFVGLHPLTSATLPPLLRARRPYTHPTKSARDLRTCAWPSGAPTRRGVVLHRLGVRNGRR